MLLLQGEIFPRLCLETTVLVSKCPVAGLERGIPPQQRYVDCEDLGCVMAFREAESVVVPLTINPKLALR